MIIKKTVSREKRVRFRVTITSKYSAVVTAFVRRVNRTCRDTVGQHKTLVMIRYL